VGVGGGGLGSVVMVVVVVVAGVVGSSFGLPGSGFTVDFRKHTVGGQ
jgi:hypothetical protein